MCFPKPWDVFVAGGGPAGLATAIAARHHGMSVIVADGAAPPIEKPCGEGLMPDGVEALRDLGIAIPESEAYPFRGVRFVSEGTTAEAEFPRGTAYGIRRTHLHRVMLDHAVACGVRTLWQAPVTGLHPEGALVAGELVRARWVVGADGTSSHVRRWAKLDEHRPNTRASKNLRFAFLRHFRVAPWTDFMELHWGRHCQVYVTPVSREEVCVALISFDSKLRLRRGLQEEEEDALAEFPDLSAHLRHAEYVSSERGAMTVTRRLRRVHRGRTVLVGDASCGIDAITGKGLCLAFRQAALLAECLASGEIDRYQRSHRALLRRPTLMAHMMLFMARHSGLRRRAMRVFQSHPRSFPRLLAMHAGEGSACEQISNGIAVGWELLKA